MALRIGSERASTVGSQGLGRGRLYAGRPERVPAGLRHAVPEDASKALCGIEPGHVFPGSTWPGLATGRELCPECLALAD